MRAPGRSEEFTAVQRESMQVVAVLRKALFARRRTDIPSPVEGGPSRPPSQFVLSRLGLAPMTVGAGKVTDRRNSTLACYFRHCG
jgi:hypothetical protein